MNKPTRITVQFTIEINEKTFQKLVRYGTELGQNYEDAGPLLIAKRAIMWEGLSAFHDADCDPDGWFIDNTENKDATK